MLPRTIGLVAVLFTLAAPAAAGERERERWVHVRVQDRTTGEEAFNINVPLSLVESALPAIGSDDLREGKLQLGDLKLDDMNLHEVLTALRDSPDTDFIRVRDDGETVRVAKEDGRLVIHVDDTGPDADKVRIVLPLAVVEAMLEPKTGEIDLVRGLHALSDYGDDLVRIESTSESVRVWIDVRPGGD